MEQKIFQICHNCKGSGKFKEQTCTDCAGTGRVLFGFLEEKTEPKSKK